MSVSIAFTPCPNDTFMLYALIHRKIHHHFVFEPVILDIQQLNEHAMNGTYDVTKVSAAIFPRVRKVYQYLHSGAAFGLSGGPLLVSFPETVLGEDSIIALPGIDTTASTLFDFFYKKPCRKIMLQYDRIIPAILNHQCDAGVIIHEDRFMFEEIGLVKIMDLGSMWIEEMSLPLPLGIFLCKNEHETDVIEKLDTLLGQSVHYALEHFEEVMEWSCQMSSEKDREIIRKHIEYYVTRLSVSMGVEGQKALEQLWHMMEIQRR